MLIQTVTTKDNCYDNNHSVNGSLDIDELAKKWVELLFENVLKYRNLELGNGKKVCKNNTIRQRKAPPPSK